MLSNHVCCFQHRITTSYTITVKDGRQNGVSEQYALHPHADIQHWFLMDLQYTPI